MPQPPEYVVTVKKWPAYVLGALILLLAALYVFQISMMASGPHALVDATSVALFVVAVAAMMVSLAGFCWMLRWIVVMIQQPPTLNTDGMWLWAYATKERQFVPWTQITAVRIARKGLAKGLFVYVLDAPDSLAGGDPGKARRIARGMRRMLGAPFSYSVKTGHRRVDELDAALRGFTGGRLHLIR
ncbi:hypothetical protein EV193_108298 [Herbihabitans rhizosphaerae]|uniref:Uncharacterized protein n=1 Tax=Herbihabitans rhizosphaerae TaxID=1872711 RepID=A0A4Q7KJ20_9PSEU|nr:hypothetical protein [Herbihabitans rhizosphaerae]RZS34948.1 hypothetical protein EV193_108298 [Herbihabitans rhizosphaerae]